MVQAPGPVDGDLRLLARQLARRVQRAAAVQRAVAVQPVEDGAVVAEVVVRGAGVVVQGGVGRVEGRYSEVGLSLRSRWTLEGGGHRNTSAGLGNVWQKGKELGNPISHAYTSSEVSSGGLGACPHQNERNL